MQTFDEFDQAEKVRNPNGCLPMTISIALLVVFLVFTVALFGQF